MRPMTPEETRARLLYRDGLMLVIDKPAGIAVHRGPKGGASLEDDFDALRFGLPRKPALAHRLDRETAGCLVLGRHHKALEKLGAAVQAGQDRARPIGRSSRAARRRRGAHRPAARPARRDARLVDEGRRRRAAGADAMAGARPRRLDGRADRLAGALAADRPHPSIARPLRRRGLADRSATPSTARRATRRRRRCNCSPGASRSRCPRPSRRSSSRRRRRRICAEALAACGCAGDPAGAESPRGRA